MIPGFEIFSEGKDGQNFKKHHILGIGLENIPEMKGAQFVINEIVKENGIPILCHPEWIDGAHYSLLDFENLTGYALTERTTKWDFMLSKGKKMFNICSDDSHQVINDKGFDKGFVMVYADNLTQNDIIESLKSGNFYSSTGAFISSIKVENDMIKVVCPQKASIIFFGFASFTLLNKKDETEASYKIAGNEGYVRIRIAYEINGKTAYAFTNPIIIVRK